MGSHFLTDGEFAISGSTLTTTPTPCLSRKFWKHVCIKFDVVKRPKKSLDAPCVSQVFWGMAMITNMDRMVMELGGRTAVSSALGVGANMISVWKTRGAIPSRHVLTLTRLARSHGIELDDALFEKPAHAAPSSKRSGEHAAD